MRRSASNSVFWTVAVVFALSCPLKADDWIDDIELESHFRQTLLKWKEDGTFPNGKTIVEQLKRKSHKATLPESPESSDSKPVAQARSATYAVGHIFLCPDCGEWHSNLAGGVAISPTGLILTNDHVLRFREAEVYGVMNAAGDVFPVTEVLAASRQDDLALIQVEVPSPIPYVSLSESVDTGDKVFVISHPDAHLFSYTEGAVSRFYLDTEKKIPRVQLTADFARGSSGSGIFDQAGKLAGLVVSTRSIYYDEEEDLPQLQMVVRSGAPLVSIRKFLGINN